MNLPRPASMAAVVLLAGLTARAQEPLVPAKELRPLEDVAKRLAKTGIHSETMAVLESLRFLGYPSRGMTTLETACKKDLRKKKPAKFDPAQLAAAVSKAVTRLDAVCAAATGDAQKAIARQIIALDGRHQRAHEIVGNVQSHGGWIEPWMKPIFEREVAIHGAIAAAKSLAIEPRRVTQSDEVLLEGALGKPGTLAEGWNVTIHTSLSRQDARQVMVDFARSMAFTNFLLHGEVKPMRARAFGLLLVDSMERWEKLIDTLQSKGRMPADEAANNKKASFFWDPRNEYLVMRARDLGEFSSYILSEALNRLPYRQQQFLRAGLANYVCLAMLGRRLPEYVSPSGTPQNASASGTSTPERRRADAGLIGLGEYLGDQVRRGVDPPWKDSFLPTIGEIQGDLLLKCTGIMQFLCAQGPIDAWMKECHEAKATDPETRLQQFEGACKTTVNDVETKWRTWVRGSAASLTERLAARSNTLVRKDLSALLKALAKARKAATTSEQEPEPLALNGALSRGAAQHAAYLNALGGPPADATAARVEDPSKPGFSIGGMRAGTNCVVAFGIDKPAKAIETWLGTLYDRVELLHPGILTVGFAIDNKTAVLDCGSLVTRPYGEFFIKWPYDGMKKVPTRYSKEVRNPVPGDAAGELGYPVTLQLFRGEQTPAGDVEMKLFLGSAKRGKPVECHVSTPDQPSNPKIVPANTYALIPKAPLVSGKTYTVVATFKDDGIDMVWTFKT